MMSLVPELPSVVHKVGPRYGVQVKNAETINSGDLVVMDALQAVIDHNTPSTTYDKIVIGATFDKANATYANLKKIEDTTVHTGTVPIIGSGKLEALMIAGVSVTTNPIDYDLRGAPTDVTDYTFDTTQYGGQDFRRATIITQGMVWMRYDGADFPAVGEGVVPSATTNGRVTKLDLISGGDAFTAGDRFAHMCVGITWGTYDDGTDKYVLLRLTPDLW